MKAVRKFVRFNELMVLIRFDHHISHYTLNNINKYKAFQKSRTWIKIKFNVSNNKPFSEPKTISKKTENL